MSFLDPKERVIDVELTPYGRYLISIGKFKPDMYAFYDDDIIYDRKFVDSTSAETQNNIEKSIQEETPRLNAQGLRRGAEVGLFSTNTNLVHELMPGVQSDKKNDITIQNFPSSPYLLQNPLGQGAYNSKNVPAWSVGFYKSELSSSNTVFTGSKNEVPTSFIPQLNCNIKNSVDIFPSDLDLKDKLYGDQGLQPTETSDSEIYDDQIVFFDGTYITYDKDYVFLQVEEANTEFIKNNFEIEVYEILEVSGSSSSSNFGQKHSQALKRLFFDKEETGEGDTDPSFVEYYFDIEIDDEIDPDEFCSLKRQNNKIQDIYVDNTFLCPDKDVTPTVSLNVYGTKENQDTEGVC